MRKLPVRKHKEMMKSTFVHREWHFCPTDAFLSFRTKSPVLFFAKSRVEVLLIPGL
jgi:hypothetical protein